MDFQVILDWYRANLIDNRWRQDTLPPGEVIKHELAFYFFILVFPVTLLTSLSL